MAPFGCDGVSGWFIVQVSDLQSNFYIYKRLFEFIVWMGDYVNNWWLLGVSAFRGRGEMDRSGKLFSKAGYLFSVHVILLSNAGYLFSVHAILLSKAAHLLSITADLFSKVPILFSILQKDKNLSQP